MKSALLYCHMPRYSTKVMDHFSNPRNVGVIEDADAVGRERNPACGDTMTLYLKIRDGIIVDARFQTLGCTASIAVSSVTTELVKGKSLEEARMIDRHCLGDAVDGLPPGKTHAGVLVADALQAALGDYKDRSAPDTA